MARALELRPVAQALGLDPDRRRHATRSGVAVRAPDGRFGVALSTGGTAIMLRGRVGDVPIYGAGLYAGAHGAAAATGTGERIIEAMLAHTVHGWLAAGAGAQQAADRAVALIGDKGPTGIIVVSPTELAAAAARPMAWAGREAGGALAGTRPDPDADRPSRYSMKRSRSGRVGRRQASSRPNSR